MATQNAKDLLAEWTEDGKYALDMLNKEDRDKKDIVLIVSKYISTKIEKKKVWSNGRILLLDVDPMGYAIKLTQKECDRMASDFGVEAIQIVMRRPPEIQINLF